jgi:hypothetical protein
VKAIEQDALNSDYARFPATRTGDFPFLREVQTGSGAHQASYTVGTGGCFLAVKRQGREADRSPRSSAEVKNGGAMRLHGMARN